MAGAVKQVGAEERRRLLQFLEQGGITDDPERWLSEVAASTVRALAARGEATAVELGEDEPRLREQLLLAEGKPYEARQNLSTRVLFLLGAEGRIMRGRPRGSWTSSQYRWSVTEAWLPDGMPDLPTDAAQVELVRRWLAAFGPATAADLRWWTGLPAGQVKRALGQCPAEWWALS
jgi:hypothetical protein